MGKKYELTNEFVQVSGIKLYRIKALKDFASVRAGDLGGYIEKEENLSQNGDAKVYDNARVYSRLPVFFGTRYVVNPIPNKGKLEIRIGCQTHTYEKWIKCGEAIAKAEDYTLFQRREYLGYIEMCKMWYEECYLKEFDKVKENIKCAIEQ